MSVWLNIGFHWVQLGSARKVATCPRPPPPPRTVMSFSDPPCLIGSTWCFEDRKRRRALDKAMWKIRDALLLIEPAPSSCIPNWP